MVKSSIHSYNHLEDTTLLWGLFEDNHLEDRFATQQAAEMWAKMLRDERAYQRHTSADPIPDIWVDYLA